MESEPVPLEDYDPEFAELIRQVANREHPRIQSLVLSVRGSLILLKDGRKIVRQTERNAPCPCGSGKKFKKCCGRS